MSIETDRLIDIYASRIADVFHRFGAENTSKREAARAALVVHIEELRADAERWKWLVHPANVSHPAWRVIIDKDSSPRQMAEAIDDAIRGRK